MVAVHPETLRALRKRSGLSQKALADATQGRHTAVGVATIKRIEALDTPRDVRQHTADCLARALGVAVEELSREPEDSEKTEREARVVGYRLLREVVRAETTLALDMVDHLYGISPKDQIAMAPLFAALLAEGSLARRKERLAEVEEKFADLEALGGRAFTHAYNRFWDSVHYERGSIEEREIFGSEAWEESHFGYEYEENNAFVAYLTELADKVDAGNINIESEWGYDFPSYEIGGSVIEEVTGDDRWAGYAMSRGHARIKDIPEDLLGEDRKDDRIAWMASRIPENERKELEALRKKLNIDLSETADPAPSPESC